MKNSKGGIYKRFVKRPMDFILSLIAIIILSPLFLIVALLVRTKLGSPVLFKQKRPGLNEEIFMMYKFRTMTDERDDNGDLLPNNLRASRFGNLLRKTSLDELPELFNILKGDMSIVGPRPLVVEYLPYYTDEERHRHDMRPGLTGYAQTQGRNYLTWEERFQLDNEYIKDCKFSYDLKIIYRTILQVIGNKNVANVGEVKTDEKGVYIYHEGRRFRPLNLERSDKHA